MSRRGYSVIDDLVAFEEYIERREELRKRKEQESKKKKPEKTSNGLGFFEGLVVAYVAQILYGPLTKLAELYLASHGVH